MDYRSLNILWLLLGAVIAISAGTQAHAAAYQSIAYEGVTQGVEGSFLKLLNKPVTVLAGKASVTGTVQVAGKAITMPATAAIAASAGSYAVTAIRAVNPLMLGAGLLAYLALENISVTDGQYGSYQYPDGTIQFVLGTVQDPLYTQLGSCATPPGGPAYDARTSTVQVRMNVPNGQWCPTGWTGYYNCSSGYPSDRCYQNVQASSITSCGGAMNINLQCATQGFLVTPEQDWQDLAAQPLPDAASEELATSPQVAPLGLPVEQPKPQATPFSVPAGTPYQKPDGSWVQPMAKITPQPDGKSAAIDLYDQPVTGPAVDADGYAEPVPESTPTDTSEDPCTINPDTLGCMHTGELDDPGIPKSNFNFDITPESSPWAASCPADRVLTFAFGSGTLSYATACSAMDMIRPLVLGLAWLIAGFILIGGVRSDG